MADAVTADTETLVNPAQSGPAAPNSSTPPPQDPPAQDPPAQDPPAGDPPPADPPALDGDKESKEPLGTTVNEDGSVSYEATGYPGLDMALEFVGKLGIGMDHPAMKATSSGDFSLIEAHLATLGDKAAGYERMIALAKDAHTQHTAKVTERDGKINSAVDSILGDSKAAVMEWASKNADDAERAEINAMLRAGPVQARAAAQLLLQAYEQAGGTVVTPASATRGNPGNGNNPNQSTTSPLTNMQFAQEVSKLHRLHGNAYINTPEYRALTSRLR